MATVTTLKDQYTQRQNESAAKINALHDQNYTAQAGHLKTQYERGVAQQQAANAQIAPQYQAGANTLAANYETQRRNANLGAMNSGLASGTAQQQQLGLQNQFTKNYGALRGEEAAAVQQGQQALADLTTGYNDSLAAARAQVESARGQDLIKNYQTNRSWYENAAQTAAKSGDFSAFKDIYGSKQATAARDKYIAEDPYRAVQTGMISEKEFKKITGLDYSAVRQKQNEKNSYKKKYGL